MEGYLVITYVLQLTGALLFGVLVYNVIVQLTMSPLRHIPGPLLARLSKRYYELISATGRMGLNGRQNAHKYGDIYVCQPETVSISDPADIRTVLSTPAITKHPYYKLLRFTGRDSIMSTFESEMVSKKRRTFGPYMTTSYVSKMESLIMEHGIEAVIEQWDKELSASKMGACKVNYCHTFNLCMFNQVSRLVFGQEIQALKNIDSQQKLEWITASTTFISMRALFQLLPRPLFYLFTRPWEHMYNQIAEHVAVSIKERKQLLSSIKLSGGKKPADLLQALMDCEDPESKVRLNAEQIHAEALLLLIGGIDPTAFTLTWTIHLLTLYPECYRRAVSEIRTAFSSKSSEILSYNQVKSTLPYLEACILESLRLVPVPSVQIPRKVPPEGTVIKGHFIPGGTAIFINTWGSHTAEKYWADPFKFDPMRFLDKDPKLNRQRRHSIFTFGYGNRICMGKHLAWVNLMTILANILRNYNISLPEGYSRRGPNVIDPQTGHPRLMDMTMFITNKPKYPDKDCQVVISKAR
ncbi:hypothetical protein IW140_006159 [Coemansia sp. RSA 1813]|nr:hypothetical protein EV178_006205 [Coemansia sp. RSA 1646]KAJ1766421.1 hypothetical protein LPJ74_005895 [Coemansia sp. RSA 1843]KAJ2085940.1 hypothetical protein IW138_006013 [Coemansia sp. RSA 986]KAJ2210575.1 hypothetical protein EV179_006139 [Coemansia sp. RSA 487]KAJ2563326.1 hypothetical protein IW140_006159 [Coemansia sp. RSA 1813]